MSPDVRDICIPTLIQVCGVRHLKDCWDIICWCSGFWNNLLGRGRPQSMYIALSLGATTAMIKCIDLPLSLTLLLHLLKNIFILSAFCAKVAETFKGVHHKRAPEIVLLEAHVHQPILCELLWSDKGKYPPPSNEVSDALVLPLVLWISPGTPTLLRRCQIFRWTHAPSFSSWWWSFWETCLPS